MKRALQRTALALVTAAAVAGGLWMTAVHQEVLLSPSVHRHRLGEVVPTLLVWGAALVGTVGLFAVRRRFAEVLLVTAVLLTSGGAAEALILDVEQLGNLLRPSELAAQAPPEAEPEREPRALVETTTVHKKNAQVFVRGHGSVKAKVRTDVVSQVSGRVVEVHPNMVSGGVIDAGEPLARINPSDYRQTMRKAEAEVDRAEAEIASAAAAIDEAKARVADEQRDLDRTRTLHERGVATNRELRKARTALKVAKAQLETARANRRAARARKRAAEAERRTAKLNVQRTRITFSRRVLVASERVAVGEYVAAGESIGEILGTSAVEIPVSLRDAALQWFTLGQVIRPPAETKRHVPPPRPRHRAPDASTQSPPATKRRRDSEASPAAPTPGWASPPRESRFVGGPWPGPFGAWPPRPAHPPPSTAAGAGEGSGAPGPGGAKAVVRTRFAGEKEKWVGHVARLQAEVDEDSRMVKAVVVVSDPFGRSNGERMLRPGTYVDVAIHGRTLEDVVAVPRKAIREKKKVWVFEPSGEGAAADGASGVRRGSLEIREVRVARRNPQWAYVEEGLSDGATVITTPLDTVTDGMLVGVERPAGEGGSSDGE